MNNISRITQNKIKHYIGKIIYENKIGVNFKTNYEFDVS